MRSAGLLQRLDEARCVVAARSAIRPVLGVVLGSGLGGLAREVSQPVVIPYGKIPHFPRGTGVAGHAGELVLGTIAGVPVAVLSGRIHAYEGGSIQDVVFPVRLLSRLGVRAVVLTNAAGAIPRSWRAGDLMLITDHINGLGSNPLIGPNEDVLGPRFPDMSRVYDPALRRVLEVAARKLRIALRQGVYIALRGPSYETPAEVRACRRLGADAVGMSTVAEAIALRHAGVRVAGLSMIANMAAGILDRPLSHEKALEMTARVGARVARLLAHAVPDLAAEADTSDE